MHIIIYSIIVLCATMIGAITGLGGGIIIKPAFDFVGIDTTSMISVYSTVAVFTMCLVSIYKRSKQGFHVQKQIALGSGIRVDYRWENWRRDFPSGRR